MSNTRIEEEKAFEANLNRLGDEFYKAQEKKSTEILKGLEGIMDQFGLEKSEDIEVNLETLRNGFYNSPEKKSERIMYGVESLRIKISKTRRSVRKTRSPETNTIMDLEGNTLNYRILVEARTNKKLFQTQLVEKIGAHKSFQATISSMERGDYAPKEIRGKDIISYFRWIKEQSGYNPYNL